MNRICQGRSFIAILIFVAVAALFLRFAAEKMIGTNIAQNEATAQTTLKLISTALENYARDHLGAFPTSFSLLVQEKPPYLDKDYTDRFPIRGYAYNCSRLDSSGYSCSAAPVRCNLSGATVYSVSTGGLFVSEKCSVNAKE